MMMRGLALVILLLSVPASLQAAEGGLPQFDPSHYSAQIFWLIIHFAVLYFIMAKLVLPRLSAQLGRRENRIASDLEIADRSQQEAEMARRAYEASLVEARAEAQRLREGNMATLAADKAAAEQKLSAELSQQVDEAHARIAAATDAMRGRMQELAVELSGHIIEKITPVRPERAELERAVGRVIRGDLQEVA